MRESWGGVRMMPKSNLQIALARITPGWCVRRDSTPQAHQSKSKPVRIAQRTCPLPLSQLGATQGPNFTCVGATARLLHLKRGHDPAVCNAGDQLLRRRRAKATDGMVVCAIKGCGLATRVGVRRHIEKGNKPKWRLVAKNGPQAASISERALQHYSDDGQPWVHICRECTKAPPTEEPTPLPARATPKRTPPVVRGRAAEFAPKATPRPSAKRY